MATRTDTSPQLNASATDVSSVSYTFATTGTFYVRACADNNSNWQGTVTESDENNNCGEWTVVTVSDLTISGSCSASPDSGFVGDTFTWSAGGISGGTGSYTYAWSGGPGAADTLSGTGTSVTKTYTTTGTKTGSVTVISGGNSKIIDCGNATVNSCYGQGCIGGNGNGNGNGDGGRRRGGCQYPSPAQPKINVPSQCCAPSPGVCLEQPKATLLANGATATTIKKDQSATLTWSSTGATTCTAAGGFSTGGASANNIGVQVSPPATSRYQIFCDGPGGTGFSNFATVTVVDPKAAISANPTRVQRGNSSTITWTVNDVSNCFITKNGATWQSGISSSGSRSDSINGQTTYTISSCRDNAGNTLFPQSVTVNVFADFQEF